MDSGLRCRRPRPEPVVALLAVLELQAARGAAMTNRTYQRLYARMKHEQKHAAMRLESLPTGVCPVRLGVGRCGGKLRATTDGGGSVIATCEWCERRLRGICRECGLPVVGMKRKAIRCALHTKLAKHEAAKRWQNAHRDHLREAAKGYAQRPEVRERRIRYKKLYRQSRPSKIAAYKKKDAEKHRERMRAYMRKYYRRTKRRLLKEYTRDGQKVLRRYAPGERPCLSGCGNTVTGRAKKCEPCRRDAYRSARETIAREYAA